MPEAEVQKLATKLASQRDIKVDYRKITGAGHFYEKELDQLGDIVERYLKRAQAEAKVAE